MVKYFLQRFACFLSGILISVAVALLVAAAFEVAFFANDAKVKAAVEANMNSVIDEIEKSYDRTSGITGIEKEAFTGTINSSNFNIISSEVARNLSYGYKTDFTSNEQLYEAFLEKLSSYASEKNLTLSRAELSMRASLAAEYAGEAINDSKTDSVNVFNYAKSTSMLIVIVASFVIIVASVIVIEVLNKGRHKRFSYLGSGISGAGVLLAGCFYYIRREGYISKYRFCEFKPYNDAIGSCILNASKYIIIIGLVLAAAGFIILVINYDYFRRKNRDAKLKREMNSEIMSDYLDADSTPKHARSEDGDFEKEIMKIDFEE